MPLTVACTSPTRRTSSSTDSLSAQSLQPVSAVGPYAARPIAMSLRAASSSSSPPSRSSSVALVQLPMTTSVRIGCSAWPIQVPLSTSFNGPERRARTVLPIWPAGPSSAAVLAAASARTSSGWLAVAVMRRGYPQRREAYARVRPGAVPVSTVPFDAQTHSPDI